MPFGSSRHWGIRRLFHQVVPVEDVVNQILRTSFIKMAEEEFGRSKKKIGEEADARKGDLSGGGSFDGEGPLDFSRDEEAT